MYYIFPRSSRIDKCGHGKEITRISTTIFNYGLLVQSIDRFILIDINQVILPFGLRPSGNPYILINI
jgi:hypothetical protein